MDDVLTVDAPDIDATDRLGRRLAEALAPGMVVALIGPLGAGKTSLVRAIAAGLGITDPHAVTSPTFILIQEYQGRIPIYHFDAYRLNSAGEFFDLGAHEYFQGDGVSLVEWANRVAACLPADHLCITIDPTGENSRRFLLEGRGERSAEVVRRLRGN
jgi:tRNA threonylcarbamoyladenosine biosynthesis protein TsaE